jgi:hypothetical protein
MDHVAKFVSLLGQHEKPDAGVPGCMSSWTIRWQTPLSVTHTHVDLGKNFVERSTVAPPIRLFVPQQAGKFHKWAPDLAMLLYR